MKKLMFLSVCLFLFSLSAHAQFEKGTWIINPSITGVGFSVSKAEKAQFGLGVKAGNFLADGIALMLEGGADWSKPRSVYALGVGGRYYFNKTGVYLGAGLRLDRARYKGGDHHTEFGLGIDAGYAFFISKTVTLEPAVYYNWCFNQGDMSKFGIKLGFGIYL